MKLDTSGWKDFQIRELFNVELSKGDIKYGDVEAGFVPLVSAGETNNGIVGYISEHGDGKAEIFPQNCITVDMFCNAHYQDKAFYSVSHGRINILRPKFVLTYNIGLFIIALINAEKYKFSYGRAVYSNVVSTMWIKLPATPDGTPDWGFIESYMKTLHYKPLTTKNKPGNAPELETERWGKFKVGELFDIVRGDRIVKDIDYVDIKDQTNCFPVITTTSVNNGVDGYYSKSNCCGQCLISAGEASGMYTTYQESPCWALDTVRIYTPKGFVMNKYIAMFFIALLNMEMPKFSYGRKAKPSNMCTLVLRLPITQTGDPDWQFMEGYIKSLPYGDRL